MSRNPDKQTRVEMYRKAAGVYLTRMETAMQTAVDNERFWAGRHRVLDSANEYSQGPLAKAQTAMEGVTGMLEDLASLKTPRQLLMEYRALRAAGQNACGLLHAALVDNEAVYAQYQTANANADLSMLEDDKRMLNAQLQELESQQAKKSSSLVKKASSLLRRSSQDSNQEAEEQKQSLKKDIQYRLAQIERAKTQVSALQSCSDSAALALLHLLPSLKAVQQDFSQVLQAMSNCNKANGGVEGADAAAPPAAAQRQSFGSRRMQAPALGVQQPVETRPVAGDAGEQWQSLHQTAHELHARCFTLYAALNTLKSGLDQLSLEAAQSEASVDVRSASAGWSPNKDMQAGSWFAGLSF